MKQILAFIVVILGAYFAPFPVFVLFALGYIVFWQGYELLVLAALIDLQFGSGGALYGYLYTVTVGTILLGAILLKPHLRFYQ